jgi:hypothetical protein
MVRTHGRYRRGQRGRGGVPHGHWKTTTFVVGLTTRGVIAPFVLDGPINRNAFETYVERAKLKALLRKAPSKPSLASGPPSNASSTSSPPECRNYFAAAGYEAT